MKILLPLSLFLWYRALSHVMVPPAFRMGLPSLIRLLRLHLIDTILLRVSLVVVKHYDKKQLEEERIYFTFYFQVTVYH